MRLGSFIKQNALALALAFDAVALGAYWYLIPRFKRPFEGLMAVLAVLGILTIVAAGKRKRLASAALAVVSVAATVFGLETLERHFRITGLFDKQPVMRLGAAPYAWDPFDPATYVAAKDRARADGVTPEALAEDFGGDVFERLGIEKGRERTRQRGKRVETTQTASEESQWLRDTPIGSELRPNNIYRQYIFDEISGRMLCDGVYTIGPHGFRITRENEKSDQAYVFYGCSFTFGSFINDDQTLPHYFSELFNFNRRVVNLSGSGNGPHHCLRDLQLNHRLGRTGIAPEEVKAVVYTFIDDHAKRIVDAVAVNAPRYALENGKLAYKGTFSDTSDQGRLEQMMNRSRIYPVLRGKLDAKNADGDFELLYAIVGEMHRICRERYGVPLTVVSWSERPETGDRFRALGVRLVEVGEAFDGDWPGMAIKYVLFDGHPGPYGNRMIARRLHEVPAEE